MKKIAIFVWVILATLSRESLAQTVSLSASKIEQERQLIEAQRKQMFDVANPAVQLKTGAMPGSDDIAREMKRVERERKEMFDPNNPMTKNAPNVFPNIPTPERAGVDIESIARQYEQKAVARRMDDLMVFASFTMPKESLKRLVSQASRIGASVVLRGFKDNSLKATALAINELGEQGGNVLINPNAFAKYQITAVPVVVLAKADRADQVDNQGCALPDNFVSVSGDVSLDYVLDEIVRRAPQFETVATRYLRQMRGY